MSQAANALGVTSFQQSSVQEDNTSKVTPELNRKRAALSSGDDLGGDFAGLGVEDPGTEGKAKKKKRMKTH